MTHDSQLLAPIPVPPATNPPDLSLLDQTTAYIETHPITTAIIGVLALVLLTLAWLTLRATRRSATRILRALTNTVRRHAADRSTEDLLTVIAASIATIVAGQGMWQFLARVIGDVHWSLRGLMFAFLEVAVVTSAVRARRSMREKYSAGIDGIAVWALTSISALLAAMEAASLPETVFRLAAPLVAAWLWERGMAIERRRIRGRSAIHWRITPERVLVRLGLAEATDRTAEEVDRQRRLTRVALASDRAHHLRATGASQRRQRRAYRAMRRAFTAAAEHTGLARDTALQEALRDQVAALRSMEQLLDVPAKSAWTPPQKPAEMTQEAKAAITAYKEWQPKLMPFPLTPSRTIVPQDVSAGVSATVSGGVSVGVRANGRPINGHSHTPPRTAPDPATVLLPTLPVSDPVSVGDPKTWPLKEGDILTVTHTGDTPGGEPSHEDDGEDRDERGRPNEQDNRRAEEWIRTRCRGRGGVGRRPTWSEVATRYGFSEGWGGNRVRAVQERMEAQGYRFLDDGTVYAPAKSPRRMRARVSATTPRRASPPLTPDR